MQKVQTRPATADDLNFVYELNRQAFQPYIEQLWVWDEGAQLTLFQAEYDPAVTEIILYKEESVGFLRVENHGEFLFLDAIVIRPAYQRRGLGTALVRRLLSRATVSGLPVRLHVLRLNSARALYERLGFQITGRDEHRLYMEFRHVPP